MQMGVRYAVLVVAAALLAAPVWAQLPTMADVDRDGATAAAGPLPEWDVAMVKPHAKDDPMMSWRMTRDGISLTNLPLEQMICSAWDMKPYQVSGMSGWMTSEAFDVTAKIRAEDVDAYKKLSAAQRREMLQKLLIERFHLKVRIETKTLPVYDLVVDKGGSKLKPTTMVDPPTEEEAKAHPNKYAKGSMSMGPGMYEGHAVEVGGLASQLGNAVGKPVNDATGLKGQYDISLHYRRDEEESEGGDADAPSVFSALQEQLGLKLVPSKGPVTTLVVDAAEKPDAD